MAEEILVKEVLTREMIEAGEDLIRRLNQSDVLVNAAFWLYLPELNTWRLMIASPNVSKDGSRKVYAEIQSVLSRISEDLYRIRLYDISVIEHDKSIVTSLRKVIKGDGTVSGRRFSKSMVGGQFIEDSYIYRVA